MARKIVLILGLFVALLPYLGFPESLDTVIYTVAGLMVAFLAWSGKRSPTTSTMEEMEGELQDATHDHVEERAPEPAPVIKKETVVPPVVSETPRETVVTPPTNDLVKPVTEDKTVAVAFAKQRTRNLKKRITQEGTPTQV
jgi:hypothetical protein